MSDLIIFYFPRLVSVLAELIVLTHVGFWANFKIILRMYPLNLVIFFIIPNSLLKSVILIILKSILLKQSSCIVSCDLNFLLSTKTRVMFSNRFRNWELSLPFWLINPEKIIFRLPYIHTYTLLIESLNLNIK